jgi:hypothetical protein
MNAFCNVVDTLPFNVVGFFLMLGRWWWRQWSCHADLSANYGSDAHLLAMISLVILGHSLWEQPHSLQLLPYHDNPFVRHFIVVVLLIIIFGCSGAEFLLVGP